MSVPPHSIAADNSFHENSQRPPVGPGEEASHCVEPVGSISGWGSPGKLLRGRSSPVLTPCLSHHARSSYHTERPSHRGFEPGGTSSPREEGELGSSPPAYLRWARHLHTLLQDPDGVALFRRYLESEGRVHADTLDFWFACEGLRKQTDPESITRLVKAIYRRYFLKTQLGIGEDLRKAVNHRIKEATNAGSTLDVGVFDRSQQEVERLITETTYPNFLHSELYLAHVQAMQNGSSSSASSGSASGSSSGSGNSGNGNSGSGPGPSSSGGFLATLHEDCELGTTADAAQQPARPPAAASHALPLTRDMLLATQKRRASELRPKPEAYAGLYLQTHGKPIHHHHQSSNWVHHSSYNPVSRQDSELQSLSSDARTESDSLSVTDGSSIREGPGSHHRYSKKQYQLHCRQVKEAASLNRDPYMHHTVIPRTQRVQKEQVYPMKPDDFAAILIEKLENVRRDQETKESLDRKLMESSDATDCVGSIGPTSLADAIREKLHVDNDDNDQDILDQHVSRVWSDRTPGLASPPPEAHRRSRPINPQALGKMGSCSVPSGMMNISPFSMPPHLYQTRPYQRHSHSRKEKDVFSTFSSDSGNVHDFPEGSEHRLHMPKSKSMPEYGDTSTSGHEGRFRQSGFREWSGSGGSRRWSSKKTELTDSGVSVVSDTPPVSLAHTNKDSRVLSWLLESDKQQMGGSSNTKCGSYSAHSGERDSSSSCSLTKTYPHRVRSGALPNLLGPLSHSRSGSLERPGIAASSSNPAPAQPFVADPSMPPLPSPHTPTQLEEARRRLMEDEGRTKQPRQRFAGSSKTMEPIQSGGSTLRRGGCRVSRGPEPLTSTTEVFTTVVFSFCDEQFPYRTKIPGQQITLRQFKEYLPKKGLYRYFFKTECEDVDTKVIQEEIMDDNEVLPLWEGKVMAQVKPVE